MRKIHVIVAVLAVLCLALFLFGSRYGFKMGNIMIAPSGDKKLLEQLSHSFWEDIQFKDFDTAASYHEPEIQKTLDIGYLLERLFMVKPEYLDIRNIEIQEVDIDSSGDRGRVRTKLLLHILNTKKTKEPKCILYWYKKNNKWFMRLESSLRPVEEDEEKKKNRRKKRAIEKIY
ncbi:hypothetical protein ACFL27_11500 [candidate division CSSED10-310 bacterium]|uniref:DUF4440 domain-containing protein n=1 Tax=candidate division CSSED10-310 bacterium TaxID=2855610 RepID=A0ABV6YX75_UNCC1